MNIIQTTSALAPEFGGIARTVPALSFELAKLGHKVELLYLDFGERYSVIDLPSHLNLSYHPLTVDVKAGMKPVWVPGYKSTLEGIVSGKDELIFHDNGIWLPYSDHVLKVAKSHQAPIITTIHGMLEPWSMNYGRIRKLITWSLYQKRRLRNNTMLLATSQEEADNIRKLGLEIPIAVIPNGTNFPDQLPPKKKHEGYEKVILFLSRIHPKKGLFYLVNAINYLRPNNWKVIIAGYDEGGHQEEVEAEILKAGVEDFFDFIGPIDDQRKWDLYENADLFILPSFSENFGIVVIEALASRTPVITTWGTPWKDLVDYNCGWWVEPSEQGLIEGLRTALSISQDQRIQMGINGRKLVEEKYTWSAIAGDMVDLYLELLKSN